MHRLLFAAGAGLTVVTLLVWALTRPVADAGVVPPDLSSSASSPRTEAAVPPPAVDTPPDRPTIAVRSGLLSEQEPPEADAPVAIRIPSLGVAAPVVPVGVEADGALEVPPDVTEVGWYQHGPGLGEPGATVVVGHVDSRTQGPGAFFELRRIEPGDRVEVTTSAGPVEFEVVARRRYPKDVIPLEDVFRRDGAPQLVLITCGGDFERASGSYQDNVVVYAVPTG